MNLLLLFQNKNQEIANKLQSMERFNYNFYILLIINCKLLSSDSIVVTAISTACHPLTDGKEVSHFDKYYSSE